MSDSNQETKETELENLTEKFTKFIASIIQKETIESTDESFRLYINDTFLYIYYRKQDTYTEYMCININYVNNILIRVNKIKTDKFDVTVEINNKVKQDYKDISLDPKYYRINDIDNINMRYSELLKNLKKADKKKILQEEKLLLCQYQLDHSQQYISMDQDIFYYVDNDKKEQQINRSDIIYIEYDGALLTYHSQNSKYIPPFKNPNPCPYKYEILFKDKKIPTHDKKIMKLLIYNFATFYKI